GHRRPARAHGVRRHARRLARLARTPLLPLETETALTATTETALTATTQTALTATIRSDSLKRSIGLLVLTLALTPGVVGSAGERGPLAYSQIGLLAHLPWQVALGQKYFEEQGLEPKGYNFESGAKSIAALIGGSADFAANALEHAIKAKVQGKNLVYVYSSTRLPGFRLAVASTHRGEVKSSAYLYA